MKKITTLLWIFLSGFFLQAQVERAVVVEHFTNTRCGICGSKNPAFYHMLENYPDVIHIAFHPSSPYSNCLFSQHNPDENDARTNFYGIYGGTPRVVVNGNVQSPSTPLLPEDILQEEIGKTTDYSVSIVHTLNPDASVEAQITIKHVSGKSTGDMNVYAVLTEQLVEYAAPNGEDMHHDVFRKVLVDTPVSLQGSNDSIVLVETYSPHPDWNQDEMQVIVLLQSESDLSVVQAARSDFATPVASVHDKKVLEGAFYPNPVTSYLHFEETIRKQFERAELYTLFGKKIDESDLQQSMDMQNLSPGYYFLVFTDEEGSQRTAKVLRSAR
jgi:hypothetical protein